MKEDLHSDLIDQIKHRISEFVDQTIEGDPKRERFKEPLKLYLLKYDLLRHAIAYATTVDSLETVIDESSQFLEKRIRHIREFLHQYAAKRKTRVYWDNQETKKEFHSEVQESKQDYFSAFPIEFLSSEYEDKMSRLCDDLVKLQQDISNSLKFTRSFEAEWPLIVLEDISKKHDKFKAVRKKQKRRQRLYRFVWGVVIAGFAISFLASNLLKLLLQNKWLLIFGGTATFGIAALKEYVISPWLRKKRLELQRKHLLSCLGDFREAELALLLHAPQDYVLDKLV